MILELLKVLTNIYNIGQECRIQNQEGYNVSVCTWSTVFTNFIFLRISKVFHFILIILDFILKNDVHNFVMNLNFIFLFVSVIESSAFNSPSILQTFFAFFTSNSPCKSKGYSWFSSSSLADINNLVALLYNNSWKSLVNNYQFLCISYHASCFRNIIFFILKIFWNWCKYRKYSQK